MSALIGADVVGGLVVWRPPLSKEFERRIAAERYEFARAPGLAGLSRKQIVAFGHGWYLPHRQPASNVEVVAPFRPLQAKYHPLSEYRSEVGISYRASGVSPRSQRTG